MEQLPLAAKELSHSDFAVVDVIIEASALKHLSKVEQFILFNGQ
jgi:hypothetical protein